MGERTSYAPGTFSWVDLSTTDPEAAKAFYGALFGWQAEDMPTGDGGTYTMLSLRGKQVGALSAQRPDEAAQGIPPHWNSYITVEDVDAVAGRVGDLGGAVLMPPFDVMEAGRLAVIADPTGGVVCLWQPRGHIGAALVNDAGALVWNELGTPDPDAARAFFAELLGWEYEVFGEGQDYWVIKNAGNSNGGIRRQTEQEAGIPANWLVYFTDESADEGTARAQGAGGTVMMPPTSIGEDRFSVIADPQGAVFALFQGDPDD